MSTPKTAAIIGYGNRGKIYTDYALKNPGKLRITAIAEPITERRGAAQTAHNIPSQNVFSDWKDLLEKPGIADGVIIATQDRMHVKPAVKALEAGYHVLLEKPMALTEEDCRMIVKASKKYNKSLNICHVLRHTDFFRKVKSIIDDGILGEIYSILHAENVSYAHMAHSYVRGNWRSSESASPMILAKSCHDLDLIYWIAGSAPSRLSSFGGLSHFRAENIPEGAPPRCTDGCPAAGHCQYNAVDTYLHGRHMKQILAKTDSLPMRFAMNMLLKHPGLSSILPVLRKYVFWSKWPTEVISRDLSKEGIMKALREGPYGRCVYCCDNDQVDHQETIIEFANGTTAVLRMHGHSHHEGRTLRIDGEHGSLRGSFGDGGSLEVHLHNSGKCIRYPIKTDIAGHSEGDYKIMENFYDVLAGRPGATSAEESLMSHLMAFAADEARTEGKVVRF